MKHTAFNMVTAFILSVLAGYWVPFAASLYMNNLNFSELDLSIKNSQINSSLKQSELVIPYFQDSFVAPVLAGLPACSNVNTCMLAEPLQSLLKTQAQKIQYLYVLRQLDQHQLPRELALLPLIESQYNPYAISSRGAGGVWQLMPNTARDYGILNHERFELEKSTDAALLFLKQLHHEFGRWELAIAAYNAGSKRVQKALIQNPAARTVMELNLPIETKNYVNSFYSLIAPPK